MVGRSNSSAMYWYPIIKDIKGINIPKTEIVEIRPEDILVLCSNIEMFKLDYGDAFNEALNNFDFPVFVKTDELAGKHDWKDTCYIASPDEFYSHLQNLAWMCRMVDVPLQGFLIREFLELETKFEFFMGNFPVAKERRYFINEGETKCFHPYWDKDVFLQEFEKDDQIHEMLKDGKLRHPLEERERLLQLLEEINTETDEEIALLTAMANKVAEVMKGAWSVDFAYSTDGKWYLIDCALAKESWHPEDCPMYGCYNKSGGLIGRDEYKEVD